MYKALHQGNSIDRLYLSRKEGGSIEDCIDVSIQELKEDYIKKE